MRALWFAVLVGCTPSAQALTPAHPAHPDAEPGQLAGPPAALRPGVADISTPPPTTTPATPAKDPHEGHTMPPTPTPSTTSTPDEKPPATKPAKKPAAKQPVPKKPTPTKDPHEGHQPTPAKPTPTKPPADPHEGHKGHGS
ncbi:MAG: hypothetical protein M4D80_15750 [Myxococcota bacterium]|nr:hypothetical protein [Myxococcota bacterium]